MATSAELQARRVAAVPRGVGNVTQIFAKTAKNAEIWSEDGKRYIDFGAGIAVVNTGHQHPRLIAAIEEQLKAFSHVCFQVTPYENYVSLAERLNAIAPVPGPAKTMLASTGAEAVENAIKYARAYTGRSDVIAFHGGFHGRTLLGMSLTGKVVPYKAKFGPMAPGIWHVPFPVAHKGITVEDAIHAIERGEPFLTPEAQQALIRDVLGEGESSQEELTPREEQVVKLVAEAHTNKEIAELLGLAEKTAENHRSNAMRKLGMRDRVELVRYAIRRGLIEP